MFWTMNDYIPTFCEEVFDDKIETDDEKNGNKMNIKRMDHFIGYTIVPDITIEIQN